MRTYFDPRSGVTYRVDPRTWRVEDGEGRVPEEAVIRRVVRVVRGRIRAAERERAERERVLRDMGLVKVRGALGGTYWE